MGTLGEVSQNKHKEQHNVVSTTLIFIVHYIFDFTIRYSHL